MFDISHIMAVILAGGLGTRLRKVVSDRPKIMAEINGKSFLHYLLDQIVDAGIGRVIISTGYMSEKIEETIGSSYKSLQIHFSKEEVPLGTGGALKLAGKFVDTKLCLVMNGDSYTKFDVELLLRERKKAEAKIILIVKAVKDCSRYGTIQMDKNNKIIEFIEKGGTTTWGLINAGVYMMNTAVLKNIPEKTPCSLEYDFFPGMTGKGIYGHETKGKFIDIGTPESYAKAEAFFDEKPAPA